MNKLCVGTLLIAAAAAASPAAAKVKDWKITPASAESVIVMRAEPQRADYRLVFTKVGQSALAKVYMIDVDPDYSAPFVARTMKPGTYKLNSLTQQKSWASCFGNGTVSFTVQPGKIYYMGTLNTMPLLDDLKDSVLTRGKSTLRGVSNFIEWEPKVKPEFVAGAADDLASVRQFVTAAMPMTTAPVEALTTVPTTFGSGGGKKLLEICN